ncbi:DNA excision repair protein ERCC-8-like isoform X5 [Zophobas morio]|uniref:DNA excision repair protein ERCC-8-like isoform X5 n=1 Tax=Zophobas morio TaxID=2755281 RepID=UPI003083A898
MIMVWDVRKTIKPLYYLQRTNTFDTKRIKKAVESAHAGVVTGLCFTPDGFELLSIGSDSKLKVWNYYLGTNKLINFPGIRARRARTLAVSLTIPRPLVYVPCHSTIKVYEIHTGELVHVLRGHYETVNALAFHPYLPELYSGGADGKILAWTPTSDEGRTPVTASISPTNYEDSWSGSEGSP